MATEIGEYIVGAYLKLILECDVVDYNVTPPVGGLEGMKELDVIGLDFKQKKVYLCEVATHIDGLAYGNGNQSTVDKIIDKHNRQKEYGEKYLTDFTDKKYMFWSPKVPVGGITEQLLKIESLELVINEKYSSSIEELKEKAKQLKKRTGNPAFRVIQILEHLR